MDTDGIFIDRCFQLALKGSGMVAPNPLVGAVIVRDNKIIGEGYHQKYGFAHAEVNAVNSVGDKTLLKGSTVYVSLEPCSHYGKTPPCAKLLVESQIKKCVIANFDPNPQVAGKGIRMLENAGIEVVCGIKERQGRYVNRRFFCYQEKKRPYVILKLAQSKDGYIDINDRSQKQNRRPYWITNDCAKVYVHQMRAENDAFMVGANTVINDDCRLNTRYVSGRNPLRLVYDRDLSIPTNRHFFDQTQPTLIFNDKKTEDIAPNLSYIKVNNPNEVTEEILQALYRRNISSLVVEGGAETIRRFIRKNLWDEALIFTGSLSFGAGIEIPVVDTRYKASTSWISDNRLDFYYNDNAF